MPLAFEISLEIGGGWAFERACGLAELNGALRCSHTNVPELRNCTRAPVRYEEGVAELGTKAHTGLHFQV